MTLPITDLVVTTVITTIIDEVTIIVIIAIVKLNLKIDLKGFFVLLWRFDLEVKRNSGNLIYLNLGEWY